MKIQFDKTAHVSSKGIHMHEGDVKHAYKCKGNRNDWILCHDKSRQTCFATVDKSFIFANAHPVN